MNYIVYKTTNIINKKYYIGVHLTNPDIFDGYIGCGVSKKDQKKKCNKGLPAAVKKYGYENFKREILFIYPDTQEGKLEAFAKEKELVNVDFVKSKDTYNLTVGGVITCADNLKKEIAQYTLTGNFIRTWPSITEAEEKLGLTSISQCLIGKSKYCGDFQWRYYTDTSNISPVTKKEKGVYQFDLAGNLIKVWPSISEATKQFNNIVAAKTNIGNVCNRKTRSAYGYYWSFKNKFEYEKFRKSKLAVAKYSIDGVFLESYNDIYEAASQFESKNAVAIIQHCIAGYQKTAFKFRWRYFYGNTSNIKTLR